MLGCAFFTPWPFWQQEARMSILQLQAHRLLIATPRHAWLVPLLTECSVAVSDFPVRTAWNYLQLTITLNKPAIGGDWIYKH